MKLSDLRPCDQCGKPLGFTFYVLRLSLAIVNRQAVQEYVGIHTFFGGRAGPALVENFVPHARRAVVVAGDEHPELLSEFLVCQDCLVSGPIDVARIWEAQNDRKRREDENAAGGVR